MADRRASSRRKTSTPQPSSKASAPQAGRITRRRGTRSVSKEVELQNEATKSTRRSARQGSVASIASEDAQERSPTAKTTRKAQKEVIGDLPTVEEADTQIAIENFPSTPPRPSAEVAVPHRSPGAVSEMSGTTAISSFTMVEAEALEPRVILRRLPKLYASLTEFLNHLAPENGLLDDDYQHIRDMQMPDSSFSADYRDYDEETTLHLDHFRGEHQRYIHLKAIHRVLLGPNRDSDATRCGLDLVLFMANLLIFAKQMIHSDRSEKEIWDALRELDNFFPSLFLPALVSGTSALESLAGDSALLQETFELALDLRTQLAILYLERSSNDSNLNPDITFNPDEALEEVFFHSPSAGGESVIRGWSISELGGEDSMLPQAFRDEVVERLKNIREFFPTDTESIERGDLVDVDGLGSNFPWDSVVLRILGWARSRTAELQGAIQNHGGIATIVEKINTEMQQPGPIEARAASVSQTSPRRKRTSLGRHRRRSSRKFDPNANIDLAVMDKLIAKERGSEVNAEAPQQVLDAEEEIQETPPLDAEEQDQLQPPPDKHPQEVVNVAEELAEEIPSPSRPPQSTAETLKLLKKAKKSDKENRVVSFFDRQEDAERVEFGDGFDDGSQPESGPSKKGKQPQRPPPKKRGRLFEGNDDDSDESDAFESAQRNTKVQERRANAKRRRLDPGSSSAPTSHQPPTGEEDADFQPTEQVESPSEVEEPDMTEVAPTSSFASQRKMARVNTMYKPRKARTGWTIEAEEALLEYMELFPQKYARILQHDKSNDGYHLLQDRTQVNLKDKVRNMAIVMIKSGSGLKTGFENVITPDSSMGRKLLEDGWEEWW